MKELTPEQRAAFQLAMEKKSMECSKLAMKLAEGKDTLPAHAKTGEAAGCDLVASIIRGTDHVDERYMGYLESHALGYEEEAAKVDDEASRVFFANKALAIRAARNCLAKLLDVAEKPKAPSIEDMKTKALNKLNETYKLAINCANKCDRDGQLHWMALGNQLIEAYVDIGLITPEEGNHAFVEATRALWDTL